VSVRGREWRSEGACGSGGKAGLRGIERGNGAESVRESGSGKEHAEH